MSLFENKGGGGLTNLQSYPHQCDINFYWEHHVCATFVINMGARERRWYSSMWASSPEHSGGGVGKGKGTCNFSSGIWISASKSWQEMLIGKDDISNDVVILGECVSIFVYICACLHFALIGKNLTAHVYGELQGNWIWNSNSRDIHVVCKISFLFPSRRESARESLLAGWWYSDPDCATTGS